MTVIDTVEELQIETINSEKKQFIYCKKCGLYITRSEFALSVEGHHEHIQCNPNGFTFVFKCFSKAPGCLLLGKPTTENTWFSGYAWKLSLCQSCGEHLGWYFTSVPLVGSHHQNEDKFFGLISDKLSYKTKTE
ncbi:MAG: hypothetical protein HQL46_00915 [Gammaproteobacteria bacterium]|nr:hypothetical protein [Gammaproteobacteria bacterium]